MARVRKLSRREVDEINAIRLDRHWSFRELAGLIDLPVSTLQHALRGRPPADLTVHRLRKWLVESRTTRAQHAAAASAAFARVEGGQP